MNGTVFRDTISLALIAFLAMVFFMLPHLNPPAEAEAGEKSPGGVMATISWPPGNVDVDMWLDGPGEPVPVGFSNKGGLLWNLLRDDLGTLPDYSPLNFENAFTRGIPPGDYRVNVQCYRCKTGPVEVVLEVTKRDHMDKTVDLIATSTITLRRNTEEKTGLAFTIKADGSVDRESMTTLFKPLRAAGGK